VLWCGARYRCRRAASRLPRRSRTATEAAGGRGARARRGPRASGRRASRPEWAYLLPPVASELPLDGQRAEEAQEREWTPAQAQTSVPLPPSAFQRAQPGCSPWRPRAEPTAPTLPSKEMTRLRRMGLPRGLAQSRLARDESAAAAASDSRAVPPPESASPQIRDERIARTPRRAQAKRAKTMSRDRFRGPPVGRKVGRTATQRCSPPQQSGRVPWRACSPSPWAFRSPPRRARSPSVHLLTTSLSPRPRRRRSILAWP